MTVAPNPRSMPQRESVIAPPGRWSAPSLAELWQYRELIHILAMREIQVRYKQTAIGIGWAVAQPVITMVVFTAIFGNFARLPSDGLPYPVFVLAALIPWQFFAKSMTEASTSLVTHGAMMSKIYFPRIIAPISSILAACVDFAIALVVLLCMMLAYGIVPKAAILALPFFVLMAMLTALAVALWLSGLNVEYRDVQYALPFLAQIWMFLTPVIYPASMVPEGWRFLFMLNPMACVIEGFRWSLLGSPTAPDPVVVALSFLVTLALAVGGLLYFSRVEQTFADRL